MTFLYEMECDAMDELINDFVAETRDNLESLTAQLLNWEKNPSDSESADSIFRFVHTVKGSCGFLDLPRLLKLSHAAEDIMSEARDGKILPTEELVSCVLAVVDQIGALTESIESGNAIFDNDQSLIDAMYDQLKDAKSPDTQEKIKHAFDELEISSEDEEDSKIGIIDISEENLNAQENENIAIPQDITENNNRSVRVSLKLLDNLMSGVSDLVLARNEVSRRMRDVLDANEVEIAFGRLSSSVAEMRDAVGLMRMQGIDRLFSSLPRLVRDINRELDKDIELKIDGGEVEVDREMVEALRDPLTHIIRNSADHGIETKEEREALGKKPTGIININARQSGNQILIEIIDDGSGIDLNKLRNKVVSSRIMTASKWESLSEKAKLEMIFAPGLSTADNVSAISGRGVGMDVVRTNISKISGSIDIENFEGEGLKLTLRLPLTLSIIAGLSLRCGDEMFAISRNAVQELILHTNKNVRIEEVGGTKIAYIRGQRLPYAKLSDLVEVDDTSQEDHYDSRTLVVIKPALEQSYVIDVDAVIDNEELVVKPGAPLLMASGLYAGTSLPDNGRPLLLLDASALALRIGLNNNNEDDMRDDKAVSEEEINEQSVKRKSALLFESLDGALKAIRLDVLDRLEEIDSSQIGTSGGIMRVRVNDNLHEIFGLDGSNNNEFIKMLRLSDGDQIKFLAVKEVLDIFKIDDNVAQSKHPELVEGVITFNDRQVELINPYQYFEYDELSYIQQDEKPLCFVADEDNEWCNKMLIPLLKAAGYQVSTSASDSDNADVILCMDTNVPDNIDSSNKLVSLRRNIAANENSRNSIYRYDRLGLLAAIESKVSKV